ncbi:hypothetical protein VPHD485_0011 [Vibrio phage D485]
MIELKKGRSLVSHGVDLSSDEDTIIRIPTSNFGLDSSYFAIINDDAESVEIAFGGVDDETPPVYPDDYFTIHNNGNYEIPSAAFAMNIKVWLRGGGRVVLVY